MECAQGPDAATVCSVSVDLVFHDNDRCFAAIATSVQSGHRVTIEVSDSESGYVLVYPMPHSPNNGIWGKSVRVTQTPCPDFSLQPLFSPNLLEEPSFPIPNCQNYCTLGRMPVFIVPRDLSRSPVISRCRQLVPDCLSLKTSGPLYRLSEHPYSVIADRIPTAGGSLVCGRVRLYKGPRAGFR